MWFNFPYLIHNGSHSKINVPGLDTHSSEVKDIAAS